MAGKPFFPGLINYMLSGPVVGMVWAGKDVVKTGRVMLGATNPLASAPGTIRGDYAIDVGKLEQRLRIAERRDSNVGIHVGRNICHGSDSVESAEREIALWFPRGVASYERSLSLQTLIYE